MSIPEEEKDPTVEPTDDEQKEDVEEVEESEEGEDDSEVDNKPVTAKEFKAFQETIQNGLNALRRHSNKKPSISNPDQKGAGNDVSKRIDTLEQSERKRQFGYENNLSPSEVDAVFKINPKPTKKTLEDPFVKGGLESIRRSSNADSNIPSGHSARVFGTEGKKWDDLDPAEKQANFGTRQKAILSSKKR